MSGPTQTVPPGTNTAKMNVMSVISGFKSLLPLFKMTQDESIQWLGKCHAYSDAQSPLEARNKRTDWGLLFRRYGVKQTQITHRHTECPDISSHYDWDENQIYAITESHPAGKNLSDRTLFFAKRAEDLMEEFYPSNTRPPSHIIHVTCTGYISPSAAQVLVAKRDWGGQVGITHAYHMGCYASLPALRLAKALNSELSQIDLVHNEMCTLHLDPTLHNPEQLVVQSLFADGHIQYTVTKTLPASAKKGLRILAIREWVLPNSSQDMTWMPGPHAMQMSLSRGVPDKIRVHLKNCFSELIHDYGADPIRILQSARFAIHPGGPKIIESIESYLELKPEQVRESYHILQTRGNMSSATLPHIWDEILRSDITSGSLVVSFAFGPGLTVFASLFEVVT